MKKRAACSARRSSPFSGASSSRTGFGLAFARGLGEYGSVIYISGNSAKHHTQVVSYVIMQKLNYVDYASATAIALAMLVIAFVTLFSINMIYVHQARRVQ